MKMLAPIGFQGDKIPKEEQSMLTYLTSQIKGWLQDWLGIDDLRERIRRLEQEMGMIEKLVESVVDSFKGYKNKSDETLNVLKSQVEGILDAIDDFFDKNEKEEALQGLEMVDRMKSLRRRFRYNRTLIDKHLDN
jgi:hypothetical protein